MGDFLHWGLPACQLGPLLRMQFQAQNGSYRAQYPSSQHSIVLLDATPAGRIWVDRAAARFLLVDISILPAFQNRGVGSELVSGLTAEATRAGVPLQCHVALTNQGSLRFHQRLGFRIVSQDGVYYALERPL
jgi:ribosomal protein S18 acetylase RimI-like enzyme